MTSRPRTPQWAAFMSELGDNFYRARTKLGLSQDRVAAAAGITKQTYQRLEQQGKKRGDPPNPTLLTLLSIAYVLRIELIDVLPTVSQDIFGDVHRPFLSDERASVKAPVPAPVHEVHGLRFP